MSIAGMDTFETCFGHRFDTPTPRLARQGLLEIVPVLWLAGLLLSAPGTLAAQNRVPRFPDVLLITVDTLRADRMSAYGYDRPTTPRIDELLSSGARFTRARTVEPLTSPALCSMLTARFPHEHGSTRNGLRLRPGLASLPKELAERGYRTAAFIGNWTLRDELSGLGEHFDEYEEVFSRKRWLGLFNSEATGEDLTSESLEWIRAAEEADERRPWLLWVHYVEPHAPYRLWEDLAADLGIEIDRGASKSDRYDTEVAFVDRTVGRLVRELSADRRPEETLILFAGDHGESLGEHGYWGHGRHLYENGLHIPMGMVWPGRIPAGAIEEPAMITDFPSTVLGLLGLPPVEGFHGFDWSPVFRGESEAPNRTGYFQAHKGAVHTDHESSDARRAGLLEVSLIEGDRKEILNLRSGAVRIYDLAADPEEVRPEKGPNPPESQELRAWLEAVRSGLEAASDLPVPELDAEARERLKTLGYID
jgi:arylsulfatase A-like enzyme